MTKRRDRTDIISSFSILIRGISNSDVYRLSGEKRDAAVPAHLPITTRKQKACQREVRAAMSHKGRFCLTHFPEKMSQAEPSLMTHQKKNNFFLLLRIP
jgi:hypothetical protein